MSVTFGNEIDHGPRVVLWRLMDDDVRLFLTMDDGRSVTVEIESGDVDDIADFFDGEKNRITCTVKET